MGVLNIYKVVQTGERRVWADFTTLPELFTSNSWVGLFDATLPNFENILLGLLFYVLGVLLFSLIKLIFGWSLSKIAANS